MLDIAFDEVRTLPFHQEVFEQYRIAGLL